MHKFIRKEFDNVPSSTGKIQDFNSSSPAWSFAWQTSGPCSKLFSRFLVKIIKLPPTKHQNFSKALAVINYLKCDPFCPFQKTLGSHPNLTILSKIFHTKQPPTPSTKAPSHHRTPVCQRDAAAAARAFTACRCRSWVRCVSRSAALRWDGMRLVVEGEPLEIPGLKITLPPIIMVFCRWKMDECIMYLQYMRIEFPFI